MTTQAQRAAERAELLDLSPANGSRGSALRSESARRNVVSSEASWSFDPAPASSSLSARSPDGAGARPASAADEKSARGSGRAFRSAGPAACKLGPVSPRHELLGAITPGCRGSESWDCIGHAPWARHIPFIEWTAFLLGLPQEGGRHSVELTRDQVLPD